MTRQQIIAAIERYKAELKECHHLCETTTPPPGDAMLTIWEMDILKMIDHYEIELALLDRQEAA